MNEFKTWLEQKYMEWLAKRGRKGTVREFSALIGVDQRLMANWMNGERKPGPDYADKIAVFLNYDLTVYKLLDLPEPDPRLLRAKTNWAYMTEKERNEVDNILERAEERHAKEEAKRPIPNT